MLVNSSGNYIRDHLPGKTLGSLFVKHHNTIQFFGYEVANVALVLNEIQKSGDTAYGLTHETYAAVALLVGSMCVWKFDFARRPALLFYGGLALTVGGLFLVAAGYSITGWAVSLASLETARGGWAALREHADLRERDNRSFDRVLSCNLAIAQVTLGWYSGLVGLITSRFNRLGQFIDGRPFLTSAFIKAPMRLEFIVKKIAEGDIVGTVVGLSWMILGDGGLAFNDEKLKAFVKLRSATS